MSKTNCAFSVKKDNSGSCNFIINGKLRVKKTARIQDTLAVENNLQVYNNVTVGGDIKSSTACIDTLEIEKLNPKNLTSGDNYIKMSGGGNNHKKWLRLRKGNDANGHAGLVLSAFDGVNYFMYSDLTSSATGVTGGQTCDVGNLFINYYGTSVSGNNPIFNSSTPIFQLCPNGDLSLSGSLYNRTSRITGSQNFTSGETIPVGATADLFVPFENHVIIGTPVDFENGYTGSSGGYKYIGLQTKRFKIDYTVSGLENTDVKTTYIVGISKNNSDSPSNMSKCVVVAKGPNNTKLLAGEVYMTLEQNDTIGLRISSDVADNDFILYSWKCKVVQTQWYPENV